MGKTQMLRYAVLGIVGVIAGSALAQPAAPTETQPAKSVVSMEEPQPGDHGTYQVRDEVTGKASATREHVVTEVTPKSISVRIKFVETSKEGFNVYDRSWNLLSAPNWKYSPYQGSMGIQTPLEVGKSWAFRADGTNITNGAIWKENGTSKIVGQETLTTKAGTFETFKIETNFSAQNVKDLTRKTEVASQTWYAPAIDHWVKRATVTKVDKHLRSSETVELVEYGRRE
jgi:hypothetical protein